MNDYRKLKVWTESIEMTVEIYDITRNFDKREIYGLTAQMRRCAVSISSNIAEGAGRNTLPQFIHFLGIAKGSANELETQLLIARKLNYLTFDSYESVAIKVKRVQGRLFNLIKSLNEKPKGKY